MTFSLASNQYLPPTIAIPSALNITAITNSFPMVCTVDFDVADMANTYIPGMQVALDIPWVYGMWQADKMSGTILSATPATITLDIDSRKFDSFSVPSSPVGKPATMVSNGSRNYQYDNNSRLVPYQSLNNMGN